MAQHISVLPNRIFKKIMPTPDGCWLWVAAIDKVSRYGRVRMDGRSAYAHRVVFELLVGPIEAETLDHLCRQRSCVNPQHLDPVSHRTNTLRGEGPAAKRARQVRCKRGHLFDELNTYIQPNGTRCCRTCRSQIKAEFTKRNPNYDRDYKRHRRHGGPKPVARPVP